MISKIEREQLSEYLCDKWDFTIEECYSENAKYIRGMKCNGLEDEELQRLADGAATWFGLFPKTSSIKNPTVYLAYVVNVAEENKLILPVVFYCLEELLKSSKTAPSIAEVSRIFEKMAEKVVDLNETAWRAEQRASKTQEKLLEAFTPATLEKIREYLPEFPEPEELVKAWQRLYSESLGFGFSDRHENGGIEALAKEIKAASLWPIVPFYNLYLASATPKDKEATVTQLVIKMGEAEGLKGKICPPRIWAKAVEEVSAQPPGDLQIKGYGAHPNDLLGEAFYSFDDPKPEVEAMWQRETEIAEEQLRKNPAERKTEKCLKKQKPKSQSPKTPAKLACLPKTTTAKA